MQKNVNQLLLCLPHLQRELGQEAYGIEVDQLLRVMSEENISVSQMEFVCSGNGDYNMQAHVLTKSDKPRETYHVVVLTDDAQLASFCVSMQIPQGIVLDAGSRDAQLPSGTYCIESLSDADGEYLERIYRRTKKIPWDIVETKRLVIREITPQDVPRLYELYADNSITAYMDDLYPKMEQEISYTNDYIRNIYGFYGYGMWLITLKDTGLVIGRAGLEYKEGYDGLELGFMLGVEYQHQGYAYEACSAILDYGKEWLGQNAFRTIVHKDNLASKHLCERLGFYQNDPEGEVESDYVEYQLLY